MPPANVGQLNYLFHLLPQHQLLHVVRETEKLCLGLPQGNVPLRHLREGQRKNEVHSKYDE